MITWRRLVGASAALALAAGAVAVVSGAPEAVASPAGTAARTGTAVQAVPPAPAVPDGRNFTALPPQRILDTRTGLGAPEAPIGPGGSIDVQVTGVGGVAATGVAAVVLNLTAVAPTAGGFLTVHPAGSARPTASAINFAAHQNVANEVIATVGIGGRVTVFNAVGSTHVVADLTGWFAVDSYYHPLTPARVLDTRSGLGAARAPVGAGHGIDVQISGRGGVPATGAVAVAVNVTGTAPTAGTFVTAYPTGEPRPPTSNLNLARGQTAAVLVVARLGTGGRITLYNDMGSTQLIADLTGWFSATGEFTPLTPSRIFDTRHRALGALGPGESRTVSIPTVVPTNADAVILSVIAVAPTAPGYLSVLPTLDPPTTSVLNFTAGQVVPNLVITPVSRSMFVTITNGGSGTTHVVVDLVGYFAELPRFTSPTVAPDAALPGSYSDVVSATGGYAPFGFSISAGTLPPGLSLTQTAPRTASVAGVPSTPGTFQVTIHVVDGRNSTADQSLSITVLPFVSRAVWAWGVDAPGKFGNGFQNDGPGPRRTSNLSDVVAVTTSLNGAYALRADGTVWAWGAVGLGDGTVDAESDVPVQVSGLTGVTAIAGGGLGTGYALKSDGTVWAWGVNDDGQVGDGTTTDRATPVQVAGLTGITAIAANNLAGYAVAADGTVWAWGGNGLFGVLGDGTTSSSTTPVRVAGLTGITSLAAKNDSAYALRSDGTVWAWGRNLNGELGDGTTVNRTTPVQVAGLNGITAIAGGLEFGYALAADGTVWAWGRNLHGELGDGTTAVNRTTPARVVGLTGVTAIAGAFGVGYALKADGSVWGMGDGSNGKLGTANSTFSPTPIRIADLPPATGLAAGTTVAYVIGTS